METVIGWRPEVGQRVRARVSLECPYCVNPWQPSASAGAIADDGRTGVVVQVGHSELMALQARQEVDDPSAPAFLAHDIWVRWDEVRAYDDDRARYKGWECPWDNHFAACELEPLEETTEPHGGSEERGRAEQGMA